MRLKQEEKRVFCFFPIQVRATFSKDKKVWGERTESFLLKALFPFVVLPRQCCRENAESALSDASPSKKTFVAKYLQNFSFTAFTACGKGGGGADSRGIKDFQSRDFLRILGPKTTLWRQPHPPQFFSRSPTKCLFYQKYQSYYIDLLLYWLSSDSTFTFTDCDCDWHIWEKKSFQI